MSTEHIIQTGIEIIIAVLLLYGFMHEEKVISFEQAIKRIVKGNFKRIVRKSIKAYEEYKNSWDLSGEPSPFEPLKQYPYHPNCRCSFQPYIESEVEIE